MSKKKNPKPAKVFGPGRILRDEIAARGMTQEDLAVAIGRSRQFVNGLVNNARPLTFEVAVLLEAALDIDSGIWLRMEHNYRMHKDAKEIEAMQRAVRRRLVPGPVTRRKTAHRRPATKTAKTVKTKAVRKPATGRRTAKPSKGGKLRVASPVVRTGRARPRATR